MSTILAETPRLIIRKPRDDDTVILNQVVNCSIDLLKPWMPWAMDPSIKATAQFIEQSLHAWSSPKQSIFPMVVMLKETEQLISMSGYNEKSDISVPFFEIGYWVHVDYQGLGLITEAVNAITRLAFDKYHAARVQIVADPNNIKSTNVAKRCGYEKEAYLKN